MYKLRLMGRDFWFLPVTSNWDKLWKIVRPKCFERVLFCADAETSAQQSLSGSCAWASTLNQGDTVSLWFWGEGYWRVSVQLCERHWDVWQAVSTGIGKSFHLQAAGFDSAETRKDWNCCHLSGDGWKANLSSRHISYQCVSLAAPLLLPWVILTGSCVQNCQPKETGAMGLWTLRYPGHASIFCVGKI